MSVEIASKLREFVVNELLYADDIDELELDAELLGSGLLDSIASAQLMLHVESEFDIKLHASDLTFENFNSLTALATLVLNRQ